MLDPNYKITPELAKILMEIESLKKEIDLLPLTPKLLAGLRETAKLSATHYSTMIEGNRLTQEEVNKVIKHKINIPGKKRNESEVQGYFAALNYIEELVKKQIKVTQEVIKKIHALVMGSGKINIKSTPYREVQNVIREGFLEISNESKKSRRYSLYSNYV
jgi:Fic family protein